MRNNNNDSKEEEDRISSLGDDVLHKILSFLNVKYAVQTCVLSKRWKTLWKSLPYLNFDYEPCCSKLNEEEEPKKRCFSELCCFNKFINQVRLHRHDGISLIKLRLCSPGTIMHRAEENLIKYAVKHKVEELYVNFVSFHGLPKYTLFPSTFYSCQSLRSLKLETNKGYHFFNALFQIPLKLPALKSLHIDGFFMEGNSFVLWFSSGCPNIETLKLVDIEFNYGTRAFSINALNMKNLEISFSYIEYCELERRKVVIDAPKLTSFKYHGTPAHVVLLSANKFACLDQVYFDIALLRDEQKIAVLDMISNVKEFSQAKSLTLSYETIKVLSEFPGLLDNSQLEYPNLKCLKLEGGQPVKDFVVSPTDLKNFFSSSTLLKIMKKVNEQLKT